MAAGAVNQNDWQRRSGCLAARPETANRFALVLLAPELTEPEPDEKDN